MLLLDVFDTIVIWFDKFLIGLVAGIYHVAAATFKIFLILSNGELISTEDYKLMLTNMYVIVGIVMLFIIAFALLKGMVNPDDKKSTESIKKIITNFITSMIMVLILPTIFGFAYDFQTAILVKQNTIGKFFGFGSMSSNNNSDNDLEKNKEQVTTGAYQIVNGVWTAFFNINSEKIEGCDPTSNEGLDACQEKVEAEEETKEDGETKKITHNLATTINNVENGDSFFRYTLYAENWKESEIEFNFLLALVAGALLIWIGVSYCIDMGVRLVKMVFYQIIAPIPIMLRVIPEGKLSGMFGKWMQITLTCYLEVFIRIAILYFSVYLCIMIKDSSFLTTTAWNYGVFNYLLIKAFIYMGVITFMRQAPKLISEVTGIDSGNMKLGIKDKLATGTFGLSSAAATLGRKTIAGLDAKRNGYNFKDGWNRIESTGPIAKLQKLKNGMMPYTFQAKESQRKADEQYKELSEKARNGQDNINAWTKTIENSSLKDELLGIKDDYGNIVGYKSKAESGDYIKYLASTNQEKYGELGKAYENRSKAKKNMLNAKAEYEAAKKSGDASKINAASKRYNEFNDSYEAFNQEWKQLIGSSKFKKENEIFTSMKYVEDKNKGLVEEKGYTAKKNVSYVTDEQFDPNSQEPQIIMSQREIDNMNNNNSSNINSKNNANLDELGKLNQQLEKIKGEIKNENNPKHLQEAQREMDEIQRKINNIKEE